MIGIVTSSNIKDVLQYHQEVNTNPLTEPTIVNPAQRYEKNLAAMIIKKPNCNVAYISNNHEI